MESLFVGWIYWREAGECGRRLTTVPISALYCVPVLLSIYVHRCSKVVAIGLRLAR